MTLASILFLAMFSVGFQTQDTLHVQINEIFQQNNAPGAVVIVVRGDSTLFLDAFGMANIEESRRIDPDKTIFRVGSISKPFTSIAVLQGIDRGLLELDRDINTYFDEPIIRDHFPTPVTLRHLLTHTAGFDDRYIGKSARTRDEALSLEESIKTLLPDRLIDSGQISSYSNFGAALAGYVLEHADGRDFNSIMENEVFEKLGMHNSSFDPDDDELKYFMTGYFPAGTEMMPLPYDYILDAPAGMMVSTARDMERFMQQILKQDGLAQAGVLSDELASEMLMVQYTHHPKLTGGFGYLWNVFDYNGHKVIGHDGGYIGSSARLWIFPDHQTAIFLAANTMDFGFISDATELLAGALLPELQPSATAPKSGLFYSDGRPISDFAATWRNTRYSKNSFTKFAVLIGIMGQEFTTTTVGDSLLAMPTFSGELRRMVRVEPLLFQSLDDDYFLAFREENGEITHAFTSGTSANERLQFLETRAVQQSLIGGSTLFFLIVAIGYPVLFLIRKIRNKETVSGSLSRYESGVALSYSSSILFFALSGFFIEPYELAIGFGYGVPFLFYISTLMPYAALIFTVLLASAIYREKDVQTFRKAFSTLVVMISIILFACLWYWQQVGWKF
jgi:CubicO group peptidase (beta-lactamase class C family)